MVMRTRRARLGTGLLAVIAIVLGSASPGETFFRCRFDHIARPTCCCDPSRSASDRSGMASNDCCCDVETYKIVQPTPQVGPQRIERPATTAVLPLPVAVLPPASESAPARVEQRDRNGPPSILLSHSFRV